MAKNLGKWTAAAAGLAGAGAAVVLAKKAAQNKQDAQAESQTQDRSDYRNTELGRHEKNSKGIYYTNGNYEAFARPEKPYFHYQVKNGGGYLCRAENGFLTILCSF